MRMNRDTRSTSYTWDSCEVSFSFRRKSSGLKKWTCVRWCVRLQTPRYMAYLRCLSLGESSVQVSPCDPPSFIIIIIIWALQPKADRLHPQ